MAVRGTLSTAQLGFSMPPYAPLFPKPPYFYKNASLMIFKYRYGCHSRHRWFQTRSS